MKTRRVSGGGCLLLCALVASRHVGADFADDRQYLAQLVAAGKLDQAELICREKLARQRTGGSDRAAYTCELLRVVTERARRRMMREEDPCGLPPRKSQPTTWTITPASPPAVLVQLQAALVELALPNSCWAASSNALTEASKQLARNVGRRLKKLGAALDERMRDATCGPQSGRLSQPKTAARHPRVDPSATARALMLLAETATDGLRDARLLSTAAARCKLEKISPGDLSPAAWWRSR